MLYMNIRIAFLLAEAHGSLLSCKKNTPLFNGVLS